MTTTPETTTVANPARELKRLMNRIADGETLGDDGMQNALDLLMSGIAPPVAMGAFLMGLRLRGETRTRQQQQAAKSGDLHDQSSGVG